MNFSTTASADPLGRGAREFPGRLNFGPLRSPTTVGRPPSITPNARRPPTSDRLQPSGWAAMMVIVKLFHQVVNRANRLLTPCQGDLTEMHQEH